MSKRKKFIFVSFLLSVGLLGIQFVKIDFRYQAIALLGGFAYALSSWALIDDLHGIEWLTALILPVTYPVSVGLFYFLLPENMLFKILILAVFGIGMYALLLTENIFSVAAIRTIQLLRAAHAVGFLLTLVTAFFLFDTILSFRLSYYFNLIFIFSASFPLFLQGLWSYRLGEKRIDMMVLKYALLLSLGISEVGMILSFWPVTVSVGSLFLVTLTYITLGISQYHFVGRLFKKTMYEYISVGIIVLLTTIIVTSWG